MLWRTRSPIRQKAHTSPVVGEPHTGQGVSSARSSSASAAKRSCPRSKNPNKTGAHAAVPAIPHGPLDWRRIVEWLGQDAIITPEETARLRAILAERARTKSRPVRRYLLTGLLRCALCDAPLIARACEGTVFVIEAGRTRSSQAKHAIDRLISVRAHILGAVLTKLDSKSSGYG